MPRNVRNFWIECEVDGRRTKVALGPQAKDGGFSLTVYQRSDGEVTKALQVQGRATIDTDGTIRLRTDVETNMRADHMSVHSKR
jgi:hypothetical protein